MRFRRLIIHKLGKCDSIYNLLKHLVGTVPGSILEVGCGEGLRTVELAKEFGVHITLVDISLDALLRVRNNIIEAQVKATYKQADALALPFKDNSFDIVWSGGLNEHFIGEERQVVFNEMARVCKHECIVIVPNALSITYWLLRKSLKLRGKWVYGFERPFSTFELRRRVKEAGLIPDKATWAGLEIGIRGIKE